LDSQASFDKAYFSLCSVSTQEAQAHTTQDAQKQTSYNTNILQSTINKQDAKQNWRLNSS
jgi:hypothetical protein